MNRVIILLTASSLALASSTACLITRVTVLRENVSILRQRVQDLEELSKSQSVVIARAQAVTGHSPKPPSTYDRVTALINRALAEPTVEEVNLAMDIGSRLKQEQLLRDPKFRAARLEADKQALWLVHSRAINALHLSDHTANKLMELLANHQLQSLEQPIGIPQGIDRFDPTVDPNNPSIWVLKRKQEEQRRQSEIEALLGSSKYQEWTEFYQAAAARGEIELLESMLVASGEPLRTDQRQPLLKAITELHDAAEADRRPEQSTSPFGGGSEADHLQMLERRVEQVARTNAHLRKVATSHLSRRQMELYEAALDRRLEMSRAQLNVHRALLAAQGRTESDVARH